MNYTSLIGRHRFKGEGLFIGVHLFRHLQGEGLKCLVTALFIPFDINGYRQPFPRPVTYNQPEDILQAGKGLTPPSDENTEVVPAYIKNDGGYGFSLFSLGSRLVLREYRLVLECDRAAHAHQGNQLLQSVPGYLSGVTLFLRCLRQQCNPDYRLIGTQAKNAGLTFFYDADFYLLPAYA